MRSQRAVQQGRAIPDVHRYLCTAQRGPCRAPECYAGDGGGSTAASQSGHQKTTLRQLGGCLCFWELGLVQVPSLPSLLLGLQHSPALCCTQHSPSQNVILLVGLVPKLCSEHSQAESLGSMGINTLAAQPSAHLCWEQQPNCLPAAPCLKHQIVPFQNPPCLISQASGS